MQLLQLPPMLLCITLLVVFIVHAKLGPDWFQLMRCGHNHQHFLEAHPDPGCHLKLASVPPIPLLVLGGISQQQNDQNRSSD